MEVAWWKLDGKGGLVSADPANAVAAWKKENASFWVDIAGSAPGELDAWLREIGLSDATRECCLEAGAMSRVRPLDSAIFFEFPVQGQGAESELVDLGFLCLTGLVITLHPGPVSQLKRFSEAMKSSAYLHDGTTVRLASMLLFWLSSQSVRAAGDLKKKVLALDERMDCNPDDVSASEILESKSTLRKLDMVADEQQAVFELLSVIHLPYFDLGRLEGAGQVLSSNTSFAVRTVDRLEKHLNDLQQRHDATQQEKTNKRLAVLTVISAIFLPLTLLTGIYGMNFDFMPELHFSYAYPAALCLMVLIAAALYRHFKRNRWLD